MPNTESIRDTIAGLMPTAEKFLERLIAFPSLPGNEHEAMLFLEEELGRLRGKVSRVELSEGLKMDSEYSWPIQNIPYDGRFNLRFERPGAKTGKTLIINAHVDVVPPSDGMAQPWEARRDGTRVFGRGACDDKGPLTAVYLAMLALDQFDVEPPGKVVLHFVNEEENGGNGTLAMIRTDERAEGCIVMEPSAGKLYSSIRGAVWFRIVFTGTSGHSGQAVQTRSALSMARKAMEAMEKYHAGLLRESRDVALFQSHPYPMPLTFGKLHAGSWPAAAPGQALLEGVMGFLPNTTRERVCAGIGEALLSSATGLKNDDFVLEFTYRHDCSVADPEGPLTASISEAARDMGTDLEIAAFPASCDAWFYSNFLNIPTVVYGPGDLRFAHSADEQIDFREIASSAAILVRAIQNFCEGSKEVCHDCAVG